MDSSEYKIDFETDEENIDPCIWAIEFAVETWEKLGFIRRVKGLRLHETSITQDLVYQFHRLGTYRSGARVLESLAEDTDGNDMEIAIETALGYLLFAVQAKVLYADHRYTAISYKVKSKHQIDLLLNYAAAKKPSPMIPLYLFYNTCLDAALFKQFVTDAKTHLGLGAFPCELWGCSLADARTIKTKFHTRRTSLKLKKPRRAPRWRWSIPGFNDINPSIALPFRELFCFFSSASAQELLAHKWFDGFQDKRALFLTKEQVDQDPFWQEMAPRVVRGIGRINPFPDGSDGTSEPSAQNGQMDRGLLSNRNQEFRAGFSPKFRLVLERPVRKAHALYRVF